MDDENVNRKRVFWKFEIGSAPPKRETKNENRKQALVFSFWFGTVQIENENENSKLKEKNVQNCQYRNFNLPNLVIF